MKKYFSIIFLVILILNAKLFSLDITGVWEVYGDTLINEDLHVLPGGEIIPSSLYSASITINGNLVNEGTIRNNSFSPLSITLSDSLISSGSFNVKSVTLNGTTVQGISTTSTTPIRAENFYINNSITVKALSDLYFMNSRITFQNEGGFDLSNGCDLYINGGHLSGANVYGPEHYTKSQTKICLYNDAYINNSTLHKVDMDGTILIDEDCILIGPLTNFGIIKSTIYSHQQPLYIEGEFTNLGEINNYSIGSISHNLSLFMKGDFTNEGTVAVSSICFEGTEIQKLKSKTKISSEVVTSYNTEGIVIYSDIAIQGAANVNGIYFCSNPLYLNGFNLYLIDTGLSYINVTGPVINDVPVSELSFVSSWCAISNSILSNIRLIDYPRVEYQVIFEGTVVNNGLLLLPGWDLTVNGNLYNSSFGIIQDNSTIFVNGNISNSGEWNNSSLIFSGSGDQFISCDVDKPFAGVTVECSNPIGIKASSDLYFTGSGLELTGHSLDLNGYDLNMSGGHLDSAVVLSTDSSARSLFKPSNGSYIKSAIINGVDLDSTLIVQGNNVILNGHLTNYGTIMNESTGNSEITLNNQFINHGTIQDNGLGYKLITNVKGDITNYGTWNNNYNYFNGENDQVILLPGESEIGGDKTYFVAESDIAPYEWYLNGSTLVDHPYFDGTKEKYLMWGLPVSTAYSGIFRCETGEGTSRNIFVYENGLPAPFITGFTIENGSTKVGIEWNPVDYAVSYKIYSSDDPYKDLSLWQFESVTNLLHHTLWDQTGGRRFYIVKAVY